MYPAFMYLSLMKNYNYFGGIDKYFKELGKVFLELDAAGIPFPADNYQQLLNRHFYISENPNMTYIESMNFAYKTVSYQYIKSEYRDKINHCLQSLIIQSLFMAVKLKNWHLFRKHRTWLQNLKKLGNFKAF